MEKYKQNSTRHSHDLREQENRIFNDQCRLKKFENSFHVDAAKLWNHSPAEIRNAVNLNAAKTEIENFCKNLPI